MIQIHMCGESHAAMAELDLDDRIVEQGLIIIKNEVSILTMPCRERIGKRQHK